MPWTVCLGMRNHLPQPGSLFSGFPGLELRLAKYSVLGSGESALHVTAIVVQHLMTCCCAAMPLINVRTSLPEVVDSASLLKELSAALAQQTASRSRM